MALTDVKVKKASPKEKDYKLSDDKGLFLLVKPNGSKYWRYKYRYLGKEKLFSIGVYPDISLKKARELCIEARQRLASGVDPSEMKRSKKMSQTDAAANSFEVVALEWFTKEKSHWSDSYRTRTLRLLEKDLFPRLGKRPVSSITPPELLSVLRRIQDRGAIETAHRARQVAGYVFKYAICEGKAERDPSQNIVGALIRTKTKSFAAVTDPKEVGSLLVKLDGYRGTPTVRAALQLAPLFFVRPSELREMGWCEIDWDTNQWEIPAERMKMKQPHIVPLCKQAIAILKDQQELTGRFHYVFPSARGAKRPMSNNAILAAMRSLGIPNTEMTGHGFRAMARTILDEVLEVPVAIIEHQLAHAVKDANGRSYNRTQHLPQRKKMMQKWADYLDSLRATVLNGNVVTLSSRRHG